MNREHFEFEKSIRLNVANETREEARVLVCWQVRNAKAQILKEEKEEVTVPPLTSIWFEKKELPEINIFEEYVSYQMKKDEEVVSEGTVLFSYPKYFRYEDPKLCAEVRGDEIMIRAESYTKSVEIQNDSEDLVLSDNYFDMNAGEKKVKILRGDTRGLKVRSVYDIH